MARKAGLISTAAALMGDDETRKKYEDQQTVLAAVQRKIFCDWTGAVLDVRTAVYLLITRDDDAPVRMAYVVDGRAWDKNAEKLTEVMGARGCAIEVTDGRKACA